LAHRKDIWPVKKLPAVILKGSPNSWRRRIKGQLASPGLPGEWPLKPVYV